MRGSSVFHSVHNESGNDSGVMRIYDLGTA